MFSVTTGGCPFTLGTNQGLQVLVNIRRDEDNLAPAIWHQALHYIPRKFRC